MEKMWTGRMNKQTDKRADDFNSSTRFDSLMYKEDILGSIAHVEMLAKQEIIDTESKDKIVLCLENILEDINSGKLEIDMNSEDIHMFIETVLTQRLGEIGKKLHTARSRNDQVALDIRLYLRNKANDINSALLSLINAIKNQAKDNIDTIMPGYTHLQRAQPITFAHQILAYGMMFSRDITRLNDAVKRMNVNPLGSCALSGTTYPTDREYTTKKLGFDSYTLNSIDGVSDRDFCVELLSVISIIMMHLSRFSEEIIIWSSWEFKFIELSDEFSTGSSIMPQKKNPDMAELVRGKTGRVYGDLIGTLTMLKGLPLAYNKDMQEDKESIFDAIETVLSCLNIFTPMIETMKTNKQNMFKAAQKGFINATDLADYLVKKGLPFRSAYKISGSIVAYCIETNQVLDELSLEDYKKYSDLFENDLYEAISLETCIKTRISQGGTGKDSVLKQIEYLEGLLK